MTEPSISGMCLENTCFDFTAYLPLYEPIYGFVFRYTNQGIRESMPILVWVIHMDCKSQLNECKTSQRLTNIGSEEAEKFSYNIWLTSNMIYSHSLQLVNLTYSTYTLGCNPTIHPPSTHT